MGQVKLRNLQSTVWRADDPPLVNGAPPLVEDLEPTAPARPPRFLLWVGVIICIYVGARLTGVLVNWLPVATPLCVGGWLLVCALAILRAWIRRTDGR